MAEMFASTRRELARIPQEWLGEERASRWRGRRIVPVGRAWHLGVLLLTEDRVLATGEVLRAADPGRRGYAAESARERALRREQALRGGFEPGVVVHVGWSEIDLAAVATGAASGPLALVEGVPSVRWSRAGDRMPLKAYLDDRLSLLRAEGTAPPGLRAG